MRAAGADVIVVAAHTGLDETYGYGREENFAKYLANEVPGIDVILAGHAHAQRRRARRSTACWSPSPTTGAGTSPTSGSRVTGSGSDWAVSTKSSSTPKMQDVAEDPALAALMKPYHDATVTYINTPIGEATGDVPGWLPGAGRRRSDGRPDQRGPDGGRGRGRVPGRGVARRAVQRRRQARRRADQAQGRVRGLHLRQHALRHRGHRPDDQGRAGVDRGLLQPVPLRARRRHRQQRRPGLQLRPLVGHRLHPRRDQARGRAGRRPHAQRQAARDGPEGPDRAQQLPGDRQVPEGEDPVSSPRPRSVSS